MCTALNKSLFWLATILLLALPVFADWQEDNTCTVGTNCEIRRTVVDDNLTIIPAACNITIVYNQSVLFNETAMGRTVAGYQNFTFNASNKGQYFSHMRCGYQNQTAIFDTSLIIGEEGIVGWQVSIPFILLVSSIIFVVLGIHYSKQRGIVPLMVRDLMIVLGLGGSILALRSGNQIISYVNNANNSLLNNLSNILDTAYIGAIIVFFLMIIAFLIELLLRLMAYIKSGAKSDEFTDVIKN